MAAINIGGGGIKVVCRKCGKPASATDFVLDPVYKMMVCPACVKARRDAKVQEKKEEEKQVEEINLKPPGWDEEDEYLEKAFRAKQQQATVVKRVDETKVRYTCKKCGYSFNFNLITKMPKVCQYCAAPVNTRFEFE